MSTAKVVASHSWAALPERGSPALLRLIAWIALRTGRWAARLFLYPITAYFILTARTARHGSQEYLARLRGHSPRWWNIFNHFHSFAATILDRIYLLRGEFDQFDISIHGKEVVNQQLDNGQGCILLGSHLGSFEVLRAVGVTQQDFPLRVLMDVSHNRNITHLFDALNPKIARTAIMPDQPDTLIRVRESLDAGYFLGMLGDRPSANDKTTRCEFLGAPADFPAGPILLAAMMHCPIILFFGLYRGGNRYDIYFERFTDEIVLDRQHRAEEIQHWTQRYVERLEHFTRLAPYNWFNFYRFWN